MPESRTDSVPASERRLLDEHHQYLVDGSGIDPDVVEARGYYSLDAVMALQLVQLEVHHAPILKADRWLAIPAIRPDGVKHGDVLRLFGPNVEAKYMWPVGTRQAVDIHPFSREHLLDRTVPIIITEGIRKGDAILTAARREGLRCVVLALNGCWGWRSRVDGGSIAVPDFHDIPWDDRKVYVVSDSDYRSNNDVASGWQGCATYLSSKTGEHRTFVVVVPPSPSTLEKQGADDYLAGGGTLTALLAQAQTPKQALLDMELDRPPLVVKTAREVIAAAGLEIPHLVEPIIPERAILVIAGHSGTYKTWHALSLALDGAFGFDWLGHPHLSARPGAYRTLYVNKEMGDIMLGARLKTLSRNPRFAAHTDYESVIDERLYVVDEAELSLDEEKHRDRLESALIDHQIQLVVLDSMSMSWHGEENSAAEVGRYMTQLRGLIERTGVTVAIIHHLVKTPQKNVPLKFAVRGSGQIIQQADSVLVLDRKDESARSDLDDRDIEILHAKSRTSLELPSFMSRFSSNEGMFHDMKYLAEARDFKATSAVESRMDPAKLESWIIGEMTLMPAMGPEGSGMRATELVAVLRASWPLDTDTPTDDRLKKRLIALNEAGKVMILPGSDRYHPLYKLPMLELDDETNDG